MPNKLPVNQVLCGDAFSILPSFPKECIDMIMFSPPYWGLRDYKIKTLPGVFAKGGVGLETHPQQFIERMVVLCKLLRRVLKKQGSMYLNLGDTYFSSVSHSDWSGTKDPNWFAGSKGDSHKFNVKRTKERSKWLQPKQKLMMPSRVAIALQEDGWILRNDIIWHKPNHMPSSVKDRLTSSYEHIFHFVKARKYYYDLDAIRQPHKPSSARWGEGRKKETAPLTHHGEGSQIFTKGYLGNPLGKNPADVIKTDLINAYREKGSILSPMPFDKRPLDRSGRAGDSPLGKNPADVITSSEAKFLNDSLSSPTRHLARSRDKYRTLGLPEGNIKGKNPSDFWSINTKPFPQAHFAVYPEAICMMPIKSSCPLQICKSCGKPRMRISRPTKTYAKKLGKAVHSHEKDLERGMRYDRKASSSFETVGWSDCGCGKGFESGIVLDPMCGAGTTLMVAHKLGRKWIGIDLNPSYVEMAKKRLRRECSQWLTDFVED